MFCPPLNRQAAWRSPFQNNNAGVGYFGLHEELNPSMLHEMVTVMIAVPIPLDAPVIIAVSINFPFRLVCVLIDRSPLAFLQKGFPRMPAPA